MKNASIFVTPAKLLEAITNVELASLPLMESLQNVMRSVSTLAVHHTIGVESLLTIVIAKTALTIEYKTTYFVYNARGSVVET